MDDHALYTFLAQQNVIATQLKDKLGRMPGCADILVDMVNHLASMLETRLSVSANMNHTLLKATAFGLYLLDVDGETMNILKRKNLKMDRFLKIIKVCAFA